MIRKVKSIQDYEGLIINTAESDVTLIEDGNMVKYDGVNVEVSIPKPGDYIYRDADGTIHFLTRESVRTGLLPSDWVFVEPYYYGWEDTDLVDMGTGILWSKRDIDLTQADKLVKTAFQYEKSFCSWGNTFMHNPISASAFSYNWGSVNAAEPWYEGQPYGETPGAELTASFAPDSGHDAARENLGAPWRMPTNAEFGSLFSNSDYITADGEVVTAATSIAQTAVDKRVRVNGIAGLYIRSRKTGNRLFFSCSGYGTGRSCNYRGSGGSYWSSTWDSARYASNLSFNSDGVNPQSNLSRFCGFAVRPVQ